MELLHYTYFYLTRDTNNQNDLIKTKSAGR